MMSAQHLMNLVNDILDISKIEAGKLELEQRVFHLPDVLRAAVEIVQADAAHNSPLLHPLLHPLLRPLLRPSLRPSLHPLLHPSPGQRRAQEPLDRA